MRIWQTKDKVRVGSVAPNFTLPSQSEEMVSLEDFLGHKPVVLSFYPKDDSPGCTKQVCAFRDDYEEFGKLDAEVIGISSDSVESHRRFTAKHRLPYTLVSDKGGEGEEAVWASDASYCLTTTPASAHKAAVA